MPVTSAPRSAQTTEESRHQLADRREAWQAQDRSGKKRERVSSCANYNPRKPASLPYREEPFPLQEGVLKAPGRQNGTNAHALHIGQSVEREAQTIAYRWPSCVLN